MTNAPPSLHTRREAATRIQRAVSALVTDQPFFGITAMHLLPAKPDSTYRTTATDGVTLFYNPQWAVAATSRQIFHAIAHCVTACSLKHHTRRGDRTPGRWQKASREVTQYILLPHDLADQEHGPGRNMSIVQVYNSLPPEPEPQGPPKPQQQGQPQDQPDEGTDKQQTQHSPGTEDQAGQPDSSQGENQGQQPSPNGNAGQDSANSPQADAADGSPPQPGQPDQNEKDNEAGEPPGQEPTQNQPGQNSSPDPSADRGEILDHPRIDGQPDQNQEELRWDDITHQAVTMASGQGMTPGNLVETISRSHAPPIDWRTQLREFMDEFAPEGRSWSRPNRRHLARGLYLAGPAADNIPDVCFAVDTSASLNTQDLARVWGEIREAADTLEPEMVRVILCDTRIQDDETYEAHELPEDLQAKGRRGHGLPSRICRAPAATPTVPDIPDRPRLHPFSGDTPRIPGALGLHRPQRKTPATLR